MDYSKNLLSKAPWRIPLPGAPGTPIAYVNMTQDDFIRQYHPSSHDIYDPTVYPDIYRSIKEAVLDADGVDTGQTATKVYLEKVPRFAFAWQQVIATKHLCHLTGNDIQFDLNAPEESDEVKGNFTVFKDDWQEKGLNEAFYRFAKSVKCTGDAAFVGFMENGKFGWSVLSYLDGDELFPHYDRRGRMDCFARRYRCYGTDGTEVSCLEVWDNKYLYRLHAPENGEKGAGYSFAGGSARVDNYILDVAEAHGFPEVPVAYLRDPYGPCWIFSQKCIEEYEIQFSQMAQNNKVFGEPILYLQGDNIAAEHDISGSIRILEMGPDDKAGYLNAQSASDSYIKELDELKQQIYDLSFIVKAPELKSGDLPAAALKILYSPAYEKAKMDAEEYNPALQDMVRIFSYGDGLEREMTLAFAALPMVAWIRPYAHLSESAIMADLATGVQNGFVSRRTASERAWFYTVDNEWQRLVEEEKETERADLLAQDILHITSTEEE